LNWKTYLKKKGARVGAIVVAVVLVLALTFVGQWLIVTFGGRMFRTLPLSPMEWLAVTVATGVLVLGGGELYRAIKRCRR